MDSNQPEDATGAVTRQRARSSSMRATGSTREDLRQHNLSLVLRLVHRAGSISRSELTRLTGLNRSTISDLVADLVSLGLASESEPETSSRVGRPSLNVSVVAEVACFVISPGYHSTTIAVVGLGGRVLAKRRKSTRINPSPEEVVETATELIAQITRELPTKTRIAGIGVPVPGQVNILQKSVRFAPHLNWVDVPLGQMLEDALGLPVRLDNDGSLSSSAERDFGAGKGFDDIIYLFGGDGGIGGGIIMGGNVIRGSTGYAGELGHVRISDSRTEDSAGLPGTLEALVKREDLIEALRLDDADDDELHSALQAKLPPRASRLVERQIDYLALAIANLVNIFNPQVVLLAGFLSALYDIDDYRLVNQVRLSSLNGARERVQIRTAALGSNLLLIGAAELAFAALLNDPAETQLFRLRDVKKPKS